MLVIWLDPTQQMATADRGRRKAESEAEEEAKPGCSTPELKTLAQTQLESAHLAQITGPLAWIQVGALQSLIY